MEFVRALKCDLLIILIMRFCRITRRLLAFSRSHVLFFAATFTFGDSLRFDSMTNSPS